MWNASLAKLLKLCHSCHKFKQNSHKVLRKYQFSKHFTPLPSFQQMSNFIMYYHIFYPKWGKHTCPETSGFEAAGGGQSIALNQGIWIFYLVWDLTIDFLKMELSASSGKWGKGSLNCRKLYPTAKKNILWNLGNCIRSAELEAEESGNSVSVPKSKAEVGRSLYHWLIWLNIYYSNCSSMRKFLIIPVNVV